MSTVSLFFYRQLFSTSNVNNKPCIYIAFLPFVLFLSDIKSLNEAKVEKNRERYSKQNTSHV